jgi:hypothetical protein
MRRLIFLLLFLLWPATSQAAVTISFYSRDFGAYYPHAFIVLKGTVDETGQKVDANYGWTSTAASIIIAGGRHVPGVISSSDAKYIAKSVEDFSFTLTDAEYRTVMARVQYWRDLPQPSYSLNDNNCVYFVADIARVLGLKADPKPGLMLKPRSYLVSVRQDNRDQIAARSRPQLQLAMPAPTPETLPPPPGMPVEAAQAPAISQLLY